MNAPINTNVQVINDMHGNPLVAVLPYDYYLSLVSTPREEKRNDLVPHAIVEAVLIKQINPVRAWREHLGFTQSEIAEKLGISQPAYAKYEKSQSLRKTTKAKIATALGINVAQLDF
ncbi:transcriptional regulator [Haemophilus paracuniculus]|uniref:Transcriptional regulator n=1 Tax=Haemophilus paracuniculus TaxID=734 RepID=A0A1T0ATU6_9PAST|nr:helix-turn-helix transcriptional regulator [Haemophilus paracuniculus]OOR99785.1 transcriptional regulator [Haemophilus paracuniculus]